MDFKKLYSRGISYEEYSGNLDPKAQQRISLISSLVDLKRYIEQINSLPLRKVLVFSEGWCPDCLINVTIVKKFVERAENWELKILGKEGNEEIINSFYPDGQGRIPTFVFLDKSFKPCEIFREKPLLVKKVEEGDDHLERVKVKKLYREGKLWEETVKDILNLFN